MKNNKNKNALKLSIKTRILSKSGFGKDESYRRALRAEKSLIFIPLY